MIEAFKIVTNKYDTHVCPPLARSDYTRTRGHSLKLKTERSKYDLRKFSFCNRIVSIWNTLPDNVINADSVSMFKNRLDKNWKNQGVYYDYKVKLTGS